MHLSLFTTTFVLLSIVLLSNARTKARANAGQHIYYRLPVEMVYLTSGNNITIRENNKPDVALAYGLVTASHGQVTCTVSGLDNNNKQVFYIDKMNAINGQTKVFTIRTNTSLDYEKQSKYGLDFTCTDENNGHFRKNLAVYVEDVNDNEPTMKTYVTNDFAMVIEGSAPGTVVAQLDVADPDSRSAGMFGCNVDNDSFSLELVEGSNMNVEGTGRNRAIYKVLTTRVLERTEYTVIVECMDMGHIQKVNSRTINIKVV